MLQKAIFKNNLKYFNKMGISANLNTVAYSNYKFLKKLMSKKKNPKILMIGGGIAKYGKGVELLGEELLKRSVNLECKKGKVVDVVGDAHKLPFKDKQFDLVISQAVFEHVKDPVNATREAIRVLKPKGIIYIELPFMQTYHPSPTDYYRFNLDGIRELLKDFKEIKSGIACGPASATTMLLNEFFAILLSFNSHLLYKFFKKGFRIILYPIKLLDYFLRFYKDAYRAASAFYFIGELK